MTDRKIFLGILSGLATGLLWGLVFVAPQILHAFTPYEIALGRFIFFGMISLLSVRAFVPLLRRLSGKDRVRILALSAAGFWFYTLLLVWSIHYNGGIITTLVIGLLPITIPLVGRNKAALKAPFISGLVLIFAGFVVLTVLPNFLQHGLQPSLSWIGTLGLIAALAMWTWYALTNAAFLTKNSFISKHEFTSLIGVISCICMLVGSLFMLDWSHLLQHSQLHLYLGWSAVLGIGSTWLAYWLWSICSTYCPPTISGPLIITETICGLLFTFIYQGRLPNLYELCAILLFTAGALLCLRSQP